MAGSGVQVASAPASSPPAPDFGMHNEEILGGLLGLSEQEQAALAEAGVTATAPVGVPFASEMEPQPSLI